eukprot:GHVU01089394.1.p2 GENE.GHVU01089394.1~~GHVU01089394.1.p2  ORF type:complete len:161 (+),score=4.68 GHVU01089394.1:73-555(+)
MPPSQPAVVTMAMTMGGTMMAEAVEAHRLPHHQDHRVNIRATAHAPHPVHSHKPHHLDIHLLDQRLGDAHIRHRIRHGPGLHSRVDPATIVIISHDVAPIHYHLGRNLVTFTGEMTVDEAVDGHLMTVARVNHPIIVRIDRTHAQRARVSWRQGFPLLTD